MKSKKIAILSLLALLPFNFSNAREVHMENHNNSGKTFAAAAASGLGGGVFGFGLGLWAAKDKEFNKLNDFRKQNNKPTFKDEIEISKYILDNEKENLDLKKRK